MRKSEFSMNREDMSIWEFESMASSEGYDIREYGLYSEESMKNEVVDRIFDGSRDFDSIKAEIEDVPTFSETDYFYYDEYRGFRPYDYDDFESDLNDFERFMDNEGYWDEEDEETQEDVIEESAMQEARRFYFVSRFGYDISEEETEEIEIDLSL